MGDRNCNVPKDFYNQQLSSSSEDQTHYSFAGTIMEKAYLPEKFDGEGTIPIEDWLDMFEVSCENIAVADDAEKLKRVPRSLSGAAWLWFRNWKKLERSPTFALFKTSIASAFPSSVTEIGAREKLNKRVQQTGESFPVYVAERLNLATRAFPSANEKELVSHIVQGALPPLKKSLMKKEIDTLTDLYKIGNLECDAECATAHSLTATANGSENEALRDSLVYMVRQFNNMNIRSNRFGNQNNRRSPNNYRGQNSRGRSFRGSPRGRFNSDRSSNRRIVCYSCGKPNHLSTECRSNPRNRGTGRPQNTFPQRGGRNQPENNYRSPRPNLNY